MIDLSSIIYIYIYLFNIPLFMKHWFKWHFSEMLLDVLGGNLVSFYNVNQLHFTVFSTTLN